MAFREVTLTEEEQKAGGGRPFKKFDAIGDKVLGFLVKKEKRTVNYKDGAKEETIYILYGEHIDQNQVKSTREFEITPPQDLRKKLEKAEREFGLQEGMGHLIQAKFSSTLTIEGRSDPMKIFTFACDTEFKPQKPLPASVTWAKSKAGSAPPPPPPPADDDIPF